MRISQKSKELWVVGNILEGEGHEGSWETSYLGGELVSPFPDQVGLGKLFNLS